MNDLTLVIEKQGQAGLRPTINLTTLVGVKDKRFTLGLSNNCLVVTPASSLEAEALLERRLTSRNIIRIVP